MSRPALVPPDALRLIAFCALIAWAPLPWGSYSNWSMNLLAALMSALGAWHLLTLAAMGTPLQRTTRDAAVPLALLAAVAIWQWIQVHTVSVSPYETREFALLATGYAAIAMLTTELLHTRRRVIGVVWFILAVAAAESAYAVAVVFSGEPYDLFEGESVTPGAASGTLFNRNHFAAYLNIALALGIGLMVGQLGRTARTLRDLARQLIDVVLSGKAGLRIVLVILVIGVILTKSRMGNVGFFVALTSAAILSTFITRRVNKGLAVFLLSIVILDVAIIGAYFGVDEVADRIQQTARSAQNGASGPETGPGGPGGQSEQAGEPGPAGYIDERGKLLDVTVPMTLHYLPFGSGAGTFAVVFPNFRTHDITAFYRNAHNDYLQVLSEMGIPGALLLFVFWCLALAGSIGALRSHDRFVAGFGFGGAMLAVYVALHATVEFNLYIPAVAMMIIIAMTLTGFVVPSLARHDPAYTPRKRRRRHRSRNRHDHAVA